MQKPIVKMSSPYTRDISRQVVTLRIIVILTIAIVIWLMTQRIYDYAVFLAVLLIPTLLITLTRVSIYGDNVVIAKYSLYGFIKNHVDLNSKNILSVTNHHDYLELDDTGIIESRAPFSFLYIFLPKVALPYAHTEFKYTDLKSEIKTFTTQLKTHEYKLAWAALNGH